MNCDGISSSGMYYGTRMNMLSAQKQLNHATRQIDGLKGHTYGDFYDQAHILMGFETQCAVLEGLTNDNALIDFKLQHTENALSSIKSTFQNFKSAFLYERNTQNRGIVDLRARANESLRQLIADLNGIDEEGNYLFSGSRFNIPPVDITQMPIPVPGTGPCTLYYQGDHLLPEQQINTGQTMTYGVTADHPAFEQLMRAYNLVANAPNQEANQAYLDEAFSLLNSGFDALVNVISLTGNNRKQISDANESMKTFKESAEDHLHDIMHADPAEVITRWTALQVQLQSTLMVMQRLQQTNLVNMMS